MSGGGGSGFCGRVPAASSFHCRTHGVHPPPGCQDGCMGKVKSGLWWEGGRERCHPGGDGKGCPRAGGGPATAGVLCYCLPSSTYSPEENVLLALSSFLYCADSELFILSGK